MKRSLLIYISICGLLLSCQIRDEQSNKPKSSNVTNPTFKEHTTVQIIDSTYDFGSVKEGELVIHEYRFKNTGTNPLVISSALASCGCTVPEKPDHPIAPGETGFIKVKFDSERRPGTAHKTITIISNASPEFPILELSGTVIGTGIE